MLISVSNNRYSIGVFQIEIVPCLQSFFILYFRRTEFVYMWHKIVKTSFQYNRSNFSVRVLIHRICCLLNIIGRLLIGLSLLTPSCRKCRWTLYSGKINEKWSSLCMVKNRLDSVPLRKPLLQGVVSAQNADFCHLIYYFYFCFVNVIIYFLNYVVFRKS